MSNVLSMINVVVRVFRKIGEKEGLPEEGCP